MEFMGSASLNISTRAKASEFKTHAETVTDIDESRHN